MNIKQNNLLVPQEITDILIGSMIGIGIFDLPNNLSKFCHESAWMPVVLGAIYPLYICILAIYISKRYPQKNILALSHKFFGKIFGSILNLLFFLYFVIISAMELSGIFNIYSVYVTPFLSPLRFVIVVTFFIAIAVYKGLKVIAKLNNIIFYLTIILFITTFIALKEGNYLNLLPVFDVNITNILSGTKESVFYYGGIEIIYLIYPYFKNQGDIKKSSLKAVLITTVIYILATIETIYYLSCDIAEKSNWSFIALSESVTIPILNNFRFIFAFLWLLICLKMVTNVYYAATLIAKDLVKALDRKSIIVILYFIIAYISIKLCETTVRAKFVQEVYEKSVLFIIAYASIVTLFVFLKKEDTK